MKHNVFILAASVCVIALAGGCEYSQNSQGQNSQGQNQNEQGENNQADAHSIEGASVTKAVTNISKNGNAISFTIPSDAREFDDAAQGTTSAIYDSARGKPSDCPVVPSTKVSKDVGDYDALSGKAEVTANFDDAGTANDVYRAGCLIIDDA